MHDEASRHLSHTLTLLTIFCFGLLLIIISIQSDLSFVVNDAKDKFEGVDVDLTVFLRLVSPLISFLLLMSPYTSSILIIIAVAFHTMSAFRFLSTNQIECYA
jgi:hypothetical protein